MASKQLSITETADKAKQDYAAMVARLGGVTPTPEQAVVFQHVSKWESNGVVVARAGTGKTWTICKSLNFLPEWVETVLFAAFGNRIAAELKAKVSDPRVDIMTLNGLGARAINRYWPRIPLDNKKRSIDLAIKTLGDFSRSLPTKFAPDVVQKELAKLITLGRTLKPYALPADLVELAERFDHVLDPMWQKQGWTTVLLAKLAREGMNIAAAERPLCIDFADQLYLPLVNGWLAQTYDGVIIDECQDMNDSQIEMCKRVVKDNGHILVVGDDRQGIFAFRGADSGSIDRLKTELDAVEMKLTVTHRCCQAVVREAQKLVSDFTAAPGNPEGIVRTCSVPEMVKQIGPGDFLLSRRNAPLATLALAFIREGRKAKIEGKDVGRGLKGIVWKLAKGSAANSIPAFLDKLNTWAEVQGQRALRLGMDDKADLIMDQKLALAAIAEGCKAVREIETRLDMLFALNERDDEGRPKVIDYIVLSSVHRAKGLEADKVWVLKDTLYPPVNCTCHHRHVFSPKDCPDCWCGQYEPDPQAMQEEQNIAYVAITRAKLELVYVKGEVE